MIRAAEVAKKAEAMAEVDSGERPAAAGRAAARFAQAGGRLRPGARAL